MRSAVAQIGDKWTRPYPQDMGEEIYPQFEGAPQADFPACLPMPNQKKSQPDPKVRTDTKKREGTKRLFDDLDHQQM